MNRLNNVHFGEGAGARGRSLAVFLAAASLLLLLGPAVAKAQTTQMNPYFSSLKADRVNVRKGPGSEYDILWIYRSLGLPVEVTASHEHWRRVRDSAGNEGWVYFRLLSHLRMALVSPWEKQKRGAKQKIIVPLRKAKSTDSATVANLEPGVKLLIKSCDGSACLVSLEGFKGWIAQTRLWGVYPGEIIK